MAISKFAKQPIDIMRLNRLKLATSMLKDSVFAWRVETMKERDMLRSGDDLNKLVLP